MSIAQTSMFMAQLELLGTPEVHHAYGELMVPLVECCGEVVAADQGVGVVGAQQLFLSLQTCLAETEYEGVCPGVAQAVG